MTQILKINGVEREFPNEGLPASLSALLDDLQIYTHPLSQP